MVLRLVSSGERATRWDRVIADCTPIGDRKLLVAFLKAELQGKIVLFLGWDPQDPDFSLLVEHILGHHLAEVDVRCFLVWPWVGSELKWVERPLHWIGYQATALVERLAAD